MILPKSNEPDPPPLLPVSKQLMQCPDCGAQISRKAPACPKCGRPIAANRDNMVWRVIFILIVLGGIGAVINRFLSLL